jgi:DNA polymerase-3 subunit beta
MHVIVAKKDLLRVLARCQGVADKKSTMPVLGNVLLEASKDSLALSATDLVLAVSGELEAETKTPGSVAVGAKDLFERVRMMPDGQLGPAQRVATPFTASLVKSFRTFRRPKVMSGSSLTQRSCRG